MTQAPEVPLYMRRDVLDPTPALAAARESSSVHHCLGAPLARRAIGDALR
jgi:hypothetical protein